MSDTLCRVTFRPSGKHVLVPPGTLMHEAALQAGVEVSIPCGGQGRCGRCLVRIEDGRVRRRTSAHLTDAQAVQGWALSCQTEVLEDTTVLVPTEIAVKKVAVSGAARTHPIRTSRPRDPAVTQHLLEIASPSLQDNVADLERLRNALRDRVGIRELRVGLQAARGLDQGLRQADWKVTVAVERDEGRRTAGRLVALRPGDTLGQSLGAAVDIGTTTVAIMLVDLRSGEILDSATSFNRQISCGEDVISRIVYSLRGDGLKRLQMLALETINALLDGLCARQGMDFDHIDHVVVAGNTTMEHIFLGLSPRYIREEPYAPVASRFPAVLAGELGLHVNPNASVYCVPAVAAYVGGDITAGVLASGLDRRQGLALFMDVGTNGEMVLGNAEWMAACACSAGPAFEGAGVRSGMRASDGAIEDVTVNYNTLEPTLSVIGGGLPMGVCGSGMIAALGEMFITGVVDKSGRLNAAHPRAGVAGRNRIVETEHGRAYVLAWAHETGTGEEIVLSEVDINNLIRTKGAIYAGVTVMLRNLGIDVSDIEEVLIGGAFGQHINAEKSILIGLLPDLPWDRFRFLGNTSVQGAYQALVSRRGRRRIEDIAGKLTYLELVADNAFMNEYTSTLFLPHTDIDSFPSVRGLLAAASGAGENRVAVARRGS